MDVCKMGKQNNNFEYFKPQNGNLLMASGSDSDDCKDSDSKELFTLPKRKFIRSKGPKSQRRSCFCCREICGAVVPLVIAVFIIATMVSISYIILGVSGMRREIELLKIQLNKVKSDEQSDLLESKSLKGDVQGKLAAIDKNEKEIQSLKGQIKFLSSQVKLLNATISKPKETHGSSKTVLSVSNDIKMLQKGMAETGGEIKKLSDDSEGTKNTITVLSKIVKSLKTDMSKLSKSVSEWDRGPLPTEVPDTLKPLIVTTSPLDKANSEQESLLKVTKLVKKIVDGYSELFKNKSSHMNKELESVKAHLKAINDTHTSNIITIEHNIAALSNASNLHRERINAIAKKLDSGPMQQGNTSSETKVLGIVKEILVDLKKHQVMISNLTRRIENMEGVNSQKREELSSAPTKSPHAEEAEKPALEPTTPAKEATTPANEATTPAKEATTPPKEATTPEKKATTPEKKATTPEKEATTEVPYDLKSSKPPATTSNPTGTSGEPSSQQLGLTTKSAISKAFVSTKPPVVTDAIPVSTEGPSKKLESKGTTLAVVNATDGNHDAYNVTNPVTNVDLTVPVTPVAPKSKAQNPITAESTPKAPLNKTRATTTGVHPVKEEVADEEPMEDSRPSEAPLNDEVRQSFQGKRETDPQGMDHFASDSSKNFRSKNEEDHPRRNMPENPDSTVSDPSKGVESDDTNGRFDALDSLDDAA
ncbi:muscle M-line assembly protein unc-89-like isoform X1 [Rhopilema esculentum]|uniref:muscle M-line assembly protein unc-89-like isoform X1 n=1 Tax=Rhopilema esculentum TaxID=499914 RepID=UPI0031DB1870